MTPEQISAFLLLCVNGAELADFKRQSEKTHLQMAAVKAGFAFSFNLLKTNGL